MKTLVYFLLIFFCATATAQVYPVFNAYGSVNNDMSRSGCQLSDGSFILFGHSTSTTGGPADDNALIMRLDSNGKLLHGLLLGGSLPETGMASYAAADGGYVVTGATSSSGAGNKDIYVAKFSAAHLLQWAYTYGGSEDEEPADIIQTSDGGYLLNGYTRTFNGNSNGFNSYILKLDSAGDTVWTHVLTTDAADFGGTCAEIDGNYYVTTNTNSSSHFGLGDMVVNKLTNSGQLCWSLAIGLNDNDNAWKLSKTADNNLLFCFHTASLSPGPNKDIGLIKMDTSGHTIWSKRIYLGSSGFDAFEAVHYQDGTIGLCGHLQDGHWRGITIKLSAAGDLLWAKKNSLGSENTWWQIKPLQNAGIGLFGYTSNAIGSGYDFLFARTDSAMNFGCGNVLPFTPEVTNATYGNVQTPGFYTWTKGCIKGTLSWSPQTDSVSFGTKSFNLDPGLMIDLPDFVTFAPDSVELYAGGDDGSYFRWNTGTTGRTLWAKSVGTYVVQAWNSSLTCYNYDTVVVQNPTSIYTVPASEIIYIPNVFTPNGDHLNDVFKAEGIISENAYEMRVISRHGETIFKTNDPNLGWDGNYQGATVAPDMFVCLVTYTDDAGVSQTVKGIFYLLR